MDDRDADELAAVGQTKGAGPWGPAFAKLCEWDPAWARACVRMSTDPWTDGVLPRKTVELISIALSGARLDPAGVRRHIQSALEAGASRDEILAVLEMASLTSIDSCALAAPILLEESHAAGRAPGAEQGVPTPACDKMRAAGQWPEGLDAFYAFDPEWTNAFMAAAIGVNANEVLPQKLVALLGVALDVSGARMDAPGVRRRIKAALERGATTPEVMEVLKLCAIQGVAACNLGAPILAEEVAARLRPEAPQQKESSDPRPDPTAPINAAGGGEDRDPAEPKRSLKEKAVQEFKRFLVMFLYLWVILGLFVLQQSIVLAEHHIDYKSYGFAFVNALVLAKVMLLADNLRLGSQFKDRPLIFPILIKSFLFATVFIVFHVLEKTVVGLFEGKTFAQSLPALGGGHVTGALLVGLIISVTLIPFFAFTEISRAMGRGELAKLIFTLDAKSDRRARGAGRSG